MKRGDAKAEAAPSLILEAGNKSGRLNYDFMRRISSARFEESAAPRFNVAMFVQ